MPEPLTSKTWIRECQECGHLQRDKEPIIYEDLTDEYKNSKCLKCKAKSLTYGYRGWLDIKKKD